MTSSCFFVFFKDALCLQALLSWNAFVKWTT